MRRRRPTAVDGDTFPAELAAGVDFDLWAPPAREAPKHLSGRADEVATWRWDQAETAWRLACADWCVSRGLPRNFWTQLVPTAVQRAQRAARWRRMGLGHLIDERNNTP